jgi:sortase A
MLIGVGALLYPTVSNAFNDWYATDLIEANNKQRKSATDLEKQMRKRQQTHKKSQLKDPYSQASLDALSFDPITTEVYVAHMVGEIFLPTIQQHLPIFDNVGEQFLQRGAAWLSSSTTLFGGLGGHSAVSGHSGIPGSKLFNDLHKLQLGDLILYKLADEYLAYKIFSKIEVKPSETKAYAKNPKKDLTTLITCTPIGVNSHRLLITGERVDFEPAMLSKIKQTGIDKANANGKNIVLASLALVLVILIIFLMMRSCLKSPK